MAKYVSIDKRRNHVPLFDRPVRLTKLSIGQRTAFTALMVEAFPVGERNDWNAAFAAIDGAKPVNYFYDQETDDE